MPAFACECPGEPGEIPRRRFVPTLTVSVPPVDVDQQPREGTHVLVVVAHDIDERPRLAESQVVEVPAGDLPAWNVAVAPQPEQLGLDGAQPSICHSVAEHTPDERQQVQVAGVQRRVGAGHSVARDQQRPVEPAAVVRHEPAIARNARRQLGKERRLVGVVWQEQLDLSEETALPPAKPDQERERARRRCEPGRLRVEAEQGSIGRWLPRQRGKPNPVDRQQRRRRLDDYERPKRPAHQLAADRHREPLGTNRRGPTACGPDGRFDRRASGPEVGQAAFQPNDRHAGTFSRRL
jgi:hypothetical protein